MGRTSKLPPSAGGAKRSDNGLPAFFKHRKQQDQQQQQQQQQQQRQGTSSGSGSTLKGKQRLQDKPDLAQSILASASAHSNDTSSQSTQISAGSGSEWQSGYEHLSGRGYQGATKDSSVRAYGRHLRSLIEQSDVLIQILDARDPIGSRSISTEAIIAANPGKRLLFVLTKIDLVPKKVLQAWLLHLRQWHPTLAFKSSSALSSSGRASRKLYTQTNTTGSSAASSSLEGSTAATLLQLLKNYARSQPKGMSLTVGIFGQPNVGKSSLINSLVRSRACSVAPRPGETKTLQTVLLDRKVRLVDSPGVAMSASARATGDECSATVSEILKGTVKLELVEDPMTPVAEILRRADPVKITKLYGLPPLDDDAGDLDPVDPTPSGRAGSQMESESTDRPTPQQLHVDFKSMRGDEMNSDAEDDDQDEDGSLDYHRDTFDDADIAEDQLSDGAEGDGFPSTAAHAVSPLRGIGYDVSDPMDFLLRLALLKGKMLRGGKPDVEGAARGVINDWNAGKISWFVKAPSHKTDSGRTLLNRGRGGKQAIAAPVASGNALENQDAQMTSKEGIADGLRPGEAPVTHEEATVVSGYSQAFDLDALFAQADAQLFGTSDSVPAASTLTNAGPAAPQNAKTALQAADVSASSLGKRARPSASDDEEQDDAGSSDDDSDSDDDLTVENQRMEAVSAPVGFTSVSEGMEAETEEARGETDSGNSTRGGQELTSYLSKKDAETDSTIGRSKIPAHVVRAHQREENNKEQSLLAQANTKKRGQKTKKSKGLDAGSLPSYLDRQTHKASLPNNVRKTVGEHDGAVDVDLGLGAPRLKRGEERRKKRKTARRSEARGDSVWQGLEEVTLD
ncbi:unnamed protein product [Parajaminaea phylloscopi]